MYGLLCKGQFHPLYSGTTGLKHPTTAYGSSRSQPFLHYSLFDEMLMTILGSDPLIHGIDAALDLHIQNNLKPTCTLWPPGPAARMR